VVDEDPPVDPSLPQLAGYTVRRVPGFRARGPYLCPACERELAPGQGHVVAWPDEQAELRRHWHLHCWRLACRRGRIA
jgi:hypothetical protein